jgi:uracil-DNA glycosylase
MTKVNPRIPESWKDVLQEEFTKDYFLGLREFLSAEKQKYTIYPPLKNIFNAYNSMEFWDVKVVILGQDPYHGVHQAHGLAFSVEDGVASPPSLKNIFKELVDDTGCSYPKSGNLTKWAKQGVLLLNAVLTVRAGEANSHRQKGWEAFTDASISAISENLENVVFILWGKPAQMKEKIIDTSKHLVLKAPHPSPLSAYRGFFGSKPFSKANEYLRAHNKGTIDWCLE